MPAWLRDTSLSASPGRRSRSRHVVRYTPWKVGKLILADCTCVYMASPRTREDFELVGRYKVSALQVEAVDRVVADVRPMCRLKTPDPAADGRDASKLHSVLSALHQCEPESEADANRLVEDYALIRPLEELLHQKCSTLRGELDSSTPRAFGVFWMVVVDG